MCALPLLLRVKILSFSEWRVFWVGAKRTLMIAQSMRLDAPKSCPIASQSSHVLQAAPLLPELIQVVAQYAVQPSGDGRFVVVSGGRSVGVSPLAVSILSLCVP
jgi:hypothetical protein